MSIKHEHATDLTAQQGSAANFSGNVEVRLIAANQEGGASAGHVTFGPGARTRWHLHSGEQVLYFLAGQGRVRSRGAQPVDAAPGDVARIPAGEEHWHGAHPDEEHLMTHLSITFGSTTWLEPVSDEDYRG